MIYSKIKSKFTKKSITVGIALVLIFLLAYSIRAQGARFNEIPDIDTYFFYRLSETYLKTGQPVTIDHMRNAPFGVDQTTDAFMPVYFPVFIYQLGGGWGLSFFHFALLYPAVMGALSIFIIFLISRDLFGYKAGLFSAFFLATVTAYIGRTAAGEYEREATASIFVLLVVWFFIKSYRSNSLKHKTCYSILSGLGMFLTIQTWGGSTYFMLVLASFSVLVLLLNKNIKNLLISYGSLVIFGLLPNNFLGFNPYSFGSTYFMLFFGIFVLIIIRYLLEKYKLIEEKNLKFVAPCLIILTIVGVLVGSSFYGPLADKTDQLLAAIDLKASNDLSTVAESQPGSIEFVAAQTDVRFNSFLPQFNWIFVIFSPWILSVLGLFILFYILYKKRDPLFLLPVIWFISSIWGTMGFVRLSFILGPPYAVLSGLCLGFIIDKALGLNLIKNASSLQKKIINPISIPIIVIVILILIVNTSSGLTYGSVLGPIICITEPQILIDGQRCLDVDSNGNITRYAEGQPWYQAMTFLREQTPKDAVVHSWWDFGYWFQYRGERATITDGGWGLRYETALWFVDDYTNWTDSFKMFKERGVKYILMDRSLIGKYGAISKIASKGKQVDNFLPFANSINQPSNTYQVDNKTVFEYRTGPYTIWIPTLNNSIAGAPIFFETRGNQIANKIFIDEICTSSGITKFRIDGQNLGGCVSFSQHGVIYVPEQLKNNIFSRLMFMDGYGLPVKKAFDNGFIQIYEVVE